LIASHHLDISSVESFGRWRVEIRGLGPAGLDRQSK
jgi:predicted secreted protein